MKCSQCGHENPEGAQFCGGCGASLRVSTPIDVGTAASEPPKSSSSKTGGWRVLIGWGCLIIIVILGFLTAATIYIGYDAMNYLSDSGKYSAEYRCTNNLASAQRRVTENPQDLWAIYDLGVVQADDCLDPVSAKANFEWVVEEYAIRQETSNQLATRITEIQGALEVAEATLMDIEEIASNPSQFEPIPNSQWTKEQLAEAPEEYRLLKAKVQALSEELERLWAEADRTANLLVLPVQGDFIEELVNIEDDSMAMLKGLQAQVLRVDLEIFSREFSRELIQKCGPPSRPIPTRAEEAVEEPRDAAAPVPTLTRDEERIRQQWHEEYSSCRDPLVEEFEKKMNLKREKYQSMIDDVRKNVDE